MSNTITCGDVESRSFFRKLLVPAYGKCDIRKISLMKECQMFKRGLADSIIHHLSRRLRFRTIFQANIKSKALLGKHDTNKELKPTAVKSFENLSEIFFY